MATSTKFHQINQFVSRVERATNAAHLSWMQRFADRINTLIIVPLDTDCPAMIQTAYTALAAAVTNEDNCYKIITRSELTDQIHDADQARDNTFIGLRTMVEALQRVGTAQQKESATRVLLAIKDYNIRTDDRYELESTNISQLIQQLEGVMASDCTTLGITALVSQLKTENEAVGTLISQRNEEQAGIDPSALRATRQQSDTLYVETVMIVNAFAVTQWEVGQSPYDHAIDVVNQDQDYYIQHVFTKTQLKKVKIGSGDLYFYYTGSETWRKAIEEHPDDNEGWTATQDNEVVYQDQTLMNGDAAVDSEAKVDPNGTYSLATPEDGQQSGGDGGEVTPVTPE